MADGHARALQRTRAGKGGVVYTDPSTGFVFYSDTKIATRGGGHGVIGLGVRFGAYEHQPKEQRELLRKRGERWVLPLKRGRKILSFNGDVHKA